MSRNLIATTLIALAALVATGCGSQKEEPPLLAVLDHTGSSTAGSTELCASNLEGFARRRYGGPLGRRGEVRADLFDATTVAAPTFPVRTRFAVEVSKQSNPDHVRRDLAVDARRLTSRLDAMVQDAGPGAGGTDLVTMLSSLGTAARGVGSTLVWICSDARDHRLPRERFGVRDVERVLSRVRANNALPDLAGIDIVVDTVTEEGRRDLTSRELAALELFVRRLVQLSGGRVVAYGPGPTFTG